MGVDAKHPDYEEYLEDWTQMADTFDGQRKVKEGRTLYLPATSGMVADGMENSNAPGYKAYEAYLKRAVFHDFVKDAITMMVNVMHRKPPTITLPTRMEPLREKITAEGHSLEALLRTINFHQLRDSRFGLLVDVPTGQGPGALPYIATYDAKSIINWDMGKREITHQALQMLVLDESENERSADFNWVKQDKYRVLLAPTSDMVTLLGSTAIAGAGFISIAIRGKDGPLTGGQAIRPSIAGRDLPYIPFTFINGGDLESTPEAPVLIGLSNLALAIYRGEADYRQTLFMQGQETLVVIGAAIDGDDESLRVGAGAKLELAMGGDAKYIGVKADGLAEQRQALENDKEQAAERGARLLDFGDTARQSGDALRIRVAARTTNLTTLAKTGAAGLQQALRHIAEFIGEDPKKVLVEPNLDFTDDSFTGQDVLEFMQAKAMGAPLSLRSIHNVFRKKDLTQKTFEDEMDEIDGEKPLTMGTMLDPKKDKPTDTSKPVDPRQKTQQQTPGSTGKTDN